MQPLEIIKTPLNFPVGWSGCDFDFEDALSEQSSGNDLAFRDQYPQVTDSTKLGREPVD